MSDTVLDRIADAGLVGADVLIAYADQSQDHKDDGPIELLPLRMATVTSASLPGRTVSLMFQLGDFALAHDLDTFNTSIRDVTSGSLTRRRGGELIGQYCVETESEIEGHSVTGDLADWEELVTQQAGRSDFLDEATFLTVIGFLTDSDISNQGASTRHMAWPSQVGADQHRRLTVYHYHPTKAPKGLELKTAVGPQLKLEANPSLMLDSRYDVRSVVVRSGDSPLGSQPSWVSLRMASSDDAMPLDLEMQVRIKGNWPKRLLIAGLIGAGLAGAQIIPLVTREDLTSGETWPIAIAVAFFSLVAGAAAAWGLRRSV